MLKNKLIALSFILLSSLAQAGENNDRADVLSIQINENFNSTVAGTEWGRYIAAIANHSLQISCLNCNDFPEASDNTIPQRESSIGEIIAPSVLILISMSLGFHGLLDFSESTTIAKAGMGLYVSELCFKMLYVFRYAFYKTWNSFLTPKDSSNFKNTPKGSILIVSSSGGAPVVGGIPVNIAHLLQPNISNLESSYLIFEAKIETIGQLGAAIFQVKNHTKLPILALIISAHGNSEEIIMEKYIIHKKCNMKLLDGIFAQLAPDAVIILNSCSAGKNENLAEPSSGNIAQFLALQANGRKIFASTNLIGNLKYLDEELVPTFNTLSYQLLPLSSVIDYDSILENTRCYQQNLHTRKLELCN